MSPASHIVSRLRKLYGVVLGREQLLQRPRPTPSPCHAVPSSHAALEQLEQRLLLANPGLDPESSLNYGLDYAFTSSGNFSLHASVYRSKLEDTIQQVNNVVGTLWQMQNTGKSTFSGFESSADWQPLGWLKTHVAYSYIDRQNDSNPDLVFTDVPKHKLNGYVQFLLDDKTWLLVESEYNAKRYSTSDGLYTAGPYGLMNLHMNAGLTDALSFHAAVNNLFDRNYEISEGYTEPGREYVVSMNYTF